jgi:predicted AlkP superfamily pyrophosphatase or phosphodiesterase
MPRSLLAALAIAATFLPGTARAQSDARLVVMLTVDQLIPDYFERYGPQLNGGLARIVRQGVYYPGGLQDHAITETAPGHSTVLSGRSPASTNIVANNLGVPDPGAPLIAARGPGASPTKFRGTTLADWMVAADPGVQVFSVSRKDRGAILPIGRMVAPILWYASGSGVFTTSTYYTTVLPDWVNAWNARGGVTRLAGHIWDLLLPESEYPEADANTWERGGQGNAFPYQLPTDTLALFNVIQTMPWMDSLTMDIALEGVKQMRLGSGPRADLLAVSLSTTDAIGHGWGPESREIRDHVIRMDRWVGWFLDSLETTVGRGRVLVALTSDHGVQPYPERVASQGQPAGRTTLREIIADLIDTLTARFRTDFNFRTDSGLLMADVAELRARGVDVDSLSSAVAARMAALTGVRRAFTPAQLAAAPADDAEAGLWRRVIPSDMGWLAAASLTENYLWSIGTTSTTHGTTNPPDVIVPIAFMGPGIAASRSARAARTIDIGPTLAALLGITPTEAVEGIVLPEVVGGQRDP